MKKAVENRKLLLTCIGTHIVVLRSSSSHMGCKWNKFWRQTVVVGVFAHELTEYYEQNVETNLHL